MNDNQEMFFKILCRGDEMGVKLGKPPMSDADREAMRAEVSKLSDEQIEAFTDKLIEGMREALRK